MAEYGPVEMLREFAAIPGTEFVTLKKETTDAVLARIDGAVRLARLVQLYFHPGPWREEQAAACLALVGRPELTARDLVTEAARVGGEGE